MMYRFGREFFHLKVGNVRPVNVRYAIFNLMASPPWVPPCSAYPPRPYCSPPLGGGKSNFKPPAQSLLCRICREWLLMLWGRGGGCCLRFIVVIRVCSFFRLPEHCDHFNWSYGDVDSLLSHKIASFICVFEVRICKRGWGRLTIEKSSTAGVGRGDA